MTFNQPLQNNDSINISTEQAQSISSNIVEPKEASWKRNLDIAITIAGAGCLFVLAHSMVMTSSSDRTALNPAVTSQSRVLPVETMTVTVVTSNESISFKDILQWESYPLKFSVNSKNS
ncbi:MAG: hypothetical protein AAGA16_16820 [Cyanobacteria bacterium P01_E01_bin.35]